MEGFSHLLNWTLKRGSHRFPGPDGGTCINEAALVAGGHAYRPITCAEDMPDGFSRPICRLAMRLNDEAGDRERQRLLPFVTRLECADTLEVEVERARYIVSRCKAFMSFDEGLAVLEGALAIGRAAEDVSGQEVRSRFDTLRAQERPPEAPASRRTVLMKLKSVFGLEDSPVA